MAAEGEGRNAVFAARSGWEVYAFDQSPHGKEKALRLAKEQGVPLHYTISDCLETEYPTDYFDAIGLIYAHFPATVKSACHRLLTRYLKPGGTVIFEAFSKQHPAYQQTWPGIGGPTDADMLFSLEEITTDFTGFDFITLNEQEVELREGLYHIGRGSVIRFTAKKKP